MFQPQPTPYLSFGAYGFGSNVLPEYTFEQTPLGTGAGFGAGESPGADGLEGRGVTLGGGVVLGASEGASLIFTSPAFSGGVTSGAPASFLQQQQQPTQQLQQQRQQQQQHQQHQRQEQQQQQSQPVASFNNANPRRRHPQPSSHIAHGQSLHSNPHQHQPSQHQQPRQQPHRNLAHRAAPGPSHSHITPPCHAHPRSRQRSIKMEPNHDEIAAQEAAAREYQPNLDGPQVGERVSSHGITEEYARADPVYVQKTIALPQTYSHYRPIQGDGNCGWRAIAFGYFETLIQNGDQAQIESEIQRLTALNDYIKNVGGIDPYVYEDMVDESFSLLKRIAAALPHYDEAMAILLSTFNTPELGNSILYHFRLLASSLFKGNRAQYEPFVTSDLGWQKYCATVLECPNVEIDNLGIVLLVNILLKPVGFVLEVAYLDRSPGTEVNRFRFPEEANAQDPTTLGPIIYLLYRPDHYDMLYRGVSLQVNHASSFSQRLEISSAPSMATFAPIDMSTLGMIPSLGGDVGGSLFLTGGTGLSPLDSYSPSPQSSWMSSPFAEDLSPQPPPPPSQAPPGPRMSPQAARPPPMEAMTPPQVDTHPLRMTKYCQMPEFVENDTWREPTFTTASFKNSHYNKAHYNNPDFQPEVYNPDAAEEHEKMEASVRGPRRR